MRAGTRDDVYFVEKIINKEISFFFKKEKGPLVSYGVTSTNGHFNIKLTHIHSIYIPEFRARDPIYQLFLSAFKAGAEGIYAPI